MIVSSISSITPSPGARGLNALLATVSSTGSAPVVVAQRLRKGSCGSPRGAKRLVADVLTAIASLSNGAVLVRADPAAYGQPTVAAALRAGASVTLEILRPVETAFSSVIFDGGQQPCPSKGCQVQVVATSSTYTRTPSITHGPDDHAAAASRWPR